MEQTDLHTELIKLQTEFIGFRTEMREKHLQNRKDIHSLRDALQSITDKFFLRLDGIREEIKGMQMESARSKGYWLGVGGVTVIIAEFLKLAVEHYWR